MSDPHKQPAAYPGPLQKSAASANAGGSGLRHELGLHRFDEAPQGDGENRELVGFAANDAVTLFTYRGDSRGKRPKKWSLPRHVLTAAAMPILGSRFVFPSRFNSLVATLASGSRGTDLNPSVAQWYFGPLLRLRVEPGRLRRRISDVVHAQGSIRWVGASFLDAANWNRALRPVHQSPIHREVSELIAADLDFRATRAYEVLCRAAGQGKPARRNGRDLASADQIDAYFQYCVDLIESIREHGIVPRGEFRNGSWLKHRKVRPPAIDSAERDVGVAINMDGELVRHLGGKHRTAIAQSLKLSTIPVELRMVHVGWLIQEMRRTGLPAHLALEQWLRSFAHAKAS